MAAARQVLEHCSAHPWPKEDDSPLSCSSRMGWLWTSAESLEFIGTITARQERRHALVVWLVC